MVIYFSESLVQSVIRQKLYPQIAEAKGGGDYLLFGRVAHNVMYAVKAHLLIWQAHFTATQQLAAAKQIEGFLVPGAVDEIKAQIAENEREMKNWEDAIQEHLAPYNINLDDLYYH